MLVPVDQFVGKTFKHYQLTKLLGQGNISAVYEAQQQEQGQPVMLTLFIVPAACTGSARERFIERFVSEASKLVRLKHPHILPLNDFGEQHGYPYLVTPLHEGSSLATLLKVQSYCTPQQVLKILKQVAEGLDYAHSQNIFHGTLKPANILLDNNGVQIAGFGLGRMLEMRGIGKVVHSHPHLFNIAGSFIVNPEYVAPEVVMGSPVDARSDVYVLGVILFELLTGAPPFPSEGAGQDPLALAMQHVEKRMPSLQAKNPDLPLALDLVLQRALERDPQHRLPSAGKLAAAFERAMNVLQEAARPAEPAQLTAVPAEATLPPTVNWFEEELASSTVQWETHGPLTTSGKMPALGSASGSLPKVAASAALAGEDGNWQLKPPVVTGPMPAVTVSSPLKAVPKSAQKSPVPATAPFSDEQGIDPLEWWSTEAPANGSDLLSVGAFSPPQPAPTTPETGKKKAAKRSKKERAQTSANVGTKKTAKPKGERAPDKGRRRMVIAATGGVVAAGIVGLTGFALMHYMRNGGQPTTMSAAQNGMANTMPTSTAAAQKMPASTTPAKTTRPTAQATTRGQPMQQGKVIGHANLAKNSFQTFTNPADNKDAILIHLPNGSFTAYERACTHQGVLVNYNPQMQKLVCPLHGSIFDPQNKGAVVQGPATTPLPMVAIHVNGDGTITAG